jgi:AcrR family transcriptional regulator
VSTRAGGVSARISPRSPRAGAPARRTGGVGRPVEDSRSIRLVEIQRSRLLSAAVKAVEEIGYTDATVAHITSRARVSRRTFYELFANREECLSAMLEEIFGLIEAEIAAVDLAALPWRERVRTGLWMILSFLDREPALAGICVVQSSRGGPAVLARRGEILGSLTAVVDEGRFESARGKDYTTLTAEGLVGAAFAIVYARLLRDEQKPLTDLLGELMGMIVLPYLGPTLARREHTRRAPRALPRTADEAATPTRAGSDPLDGVEMRLTYRTALVLEGVAERPGASNRTIADHAGIADQGQVSKLLSRLQRLGLLANDGDGAVRGEPNAWKLTEQGERVTQSICLHAHTETGAATLGGGLVTQTIRAHAGENREVA